MYQNALFKTIEKKLGEKSPSFRLLSKNQLVNNHLF